LPGSPVPILDQREPGLLFVVLGMHKSGTTLVSQILHHSGINMVDDADEGVSYDKGNKYERASTLQLDMDILGTDDYHRIQSADQANRDLTDEHRERMRRIIRETGAAHADWGFKDPRCALLYPLWVPELPEHKLVVVYRHPAEVWPRFRWVGLRRYYRNYGLAYEFLCKWHDHNLSILDALDRTSMDHLVIGYRELMQGDEAFRRLEDFIGCKLSDRRRPDLYRNRLYLDHYLRLADGVMKSRRGRGINDVMSALDEKSSP
jgi:Sulfotransferase family